VEDDDHVPTEADDWWPLRIIAEKVGVSRRQMTHWADSTRNNGFPEVKHTQGQYKFYDLVEVKDWLFFHRRATAGMGRGDELNKDK
jgi:hypothetical protein